MLIKKQLGEIPSLIFAGLRYTVASLVLVPGAARHQRERRALSGEDSWRLAMLGFVSYTLTKGGQLLTLVQSAVFVSGVFVYFSSAAMRERRALGRTDCANAAAALLGRWINREESVPPVVITCISMGRRAFCLLAFGLITQGWPTIPRQGWLVTLWLAVANSAFAFTLWDQTLRVLSAVESTTINNTMLVQIAALAWVFHGERLSLRSTLGLVLAVNDIFLVQLRPTKIIGRNTSTTPP